MPRGKTSGWSSKTERRSRDEARPSLDQSEPKRGESKRVRADYAKAKRTILERGWLSEQDQSFQTALLARATLREFPIGSRVFDVGDFRGGIYGAAGGAFGIKLPLRNGEDRLAHICHPGVWFGYDPLLSRRHRRLAFVAIEPSIAFYVPLGALEQLAATDPKYHRHLTKVAAYGMDIAIATVSDLLIPNVDKRIASALLRISTTESVESSEIYVVRGLTQAMIGEVANAARDVVNRSLKRFEAKGWIDVSYKQITLRDPMALEAFCL